MKIRRSLRLWGTLVALSAPWTLSPPARAQDTRTPADVAADEAASALEKESPPPWDPNTVKPWATQNLRLQGGVGWISMHNPTDDITVEGIGINGHVHAGDTFWELLSYYVPVRATLLAFDELDVAGTTVTSFNDKQALFVESGLGLEVWPWPNHIAISVEGVANYFGLAAVPVRRAEPTLNREAVGAAARGRLTIQFEGVGVYGEYTQQLLLQDLTNGTNWDGSQIFVGLTYHMGNKFQF
jgi:hypothetical protein